MEVPYVDLAAGYHSLKAEIDQAVLDVLDRGLYVLGENVTAFETEFSDWLGGDSRTVGVGSGTDAIYLTLKAMGIGAGDEVITVSHTAVNSALAISKAGAVPVTVDIEAESFCLDPAGLESALSVRTRAIMPVHLYGHPADMDPIMEFARENGLAVIEDCAQAHGARYRDRMVGTIGDVGCFSFYPTKNLGACGDGGAVSGRDPLLMEKISSLANCGQGQERYHNVYKGDVSRLDELQAGILRVKLRVLDNWTDKRRAVAGFYRQALASAPGVQLPAEKEWARHVYHLYVIRSKQRDALQQHLGQLGVRSLVHYPVPVHLQPAYAGEMSVSLPVTTRAVSEILSLPCFPQITDEQLRYTAASILSFR
ncbi:MAG: DegT/DnrJ/EryC1/StrS family aminotransferase [Thermoleophilia bacterium]